MDKFLHGIVITVIGMGGTLLSLGVMVLVVHLLKKLFPYREADEPKEKEVA